MKIDLTNKEVKEATAFVRTQLSNVVEALEAHTALAPDQLRIIWRGIGDFATTAERDVNN
jgi:hypothetical protein